MQPGRAGELPGPQGRGGSAGQPAGVHHADEFAAAINPGSTCELAWFEVPAQVHPRSGGEVHNGLWCSGYSPRRRVSCPGL